MMNHDLAPEDRVIVALRRIVRAIDLHSHHLAERFQVTGPQLTALKELARLGCVPVGVLARNVHVSHPTMTGILDRLERRGLVRRTRDTQDRRRMKVAVTPAGQKLLQSAPSPLQDRFRSQFSRMEEWEQTQMLATLQRIAAMMDAEELDAAPVLTSGTSVTAPDSAASPPARFADRPSDDASRAASQPAGFADDSVQD
jgi:DNA-binding MarR family transcriptional regulator